MDRHQNLGVIVKIPTFRLQAGIFSKVWLKHKQAVVFCFAKHPQTTRSSIMCFRKGRDEDSSDSDDDDDDKDVKRRRRGKSSSR